MTALPGGTALPGPLRMALWGARHIHRQDHLDAIAAHPRAELAGVWEGAAVPDLDGVDAVLLDGLTGDHATQLRALPPGMPVFVEKPLGLGPQDAAEAAALLEGRVHGTGLYLHLLPAVGRWLTEAAGARHVELAFGHDLRATHGFAGEFAWMVDPAQGGSGNFADLGIHLAALLGRLWPDARLIGADTVLEDAPDGLSDGGGSARLAYVDGRTAALSVSALHRHPLTLTADVDGVEWQVTGGSLHREGGVVLAGQEPDAALAAADFLHRLTGGRAGAGSPLDGEDSPTRPATAAETLAAQRAVERMLAAAR